MLDRYLKAYMAAEAVRLASSAHVAAMKVAERICQPSKNHLTATEKPV